jgi:hypothetical protein
LGDVQWGHLMTHDQEIEFEAQQVVMAFLHTTTSRTSRQNASCCTINFRGPSPDVEMKNV